MENIYEVISICEDYNSLGQAVQEQVRRFLEGDFDGLNPDAVDEIIRWLKGVKRDGIVSNVEDIDNAISEWKEYQSSEAEEETEEDEE